MFNSYGAVTPAAAGLLAVIALAFAVSVYLNLSSDAALAKYMSVANVTAANPELSGRKTGCPVGKKELPTQLRPLP
jgi:hypothetical protein